MDNTYLKPLSIMTLRSFINFGVQEALSCLFPVIVFASLAFVALPAPVAKI
jgi:uncharacterized membrane protein YoaT (DUF817 family)